MHNPARDAPGNELDDDCSMDEDERLDYADQQPLSGGGPGVGIGSASRALCKLSSMPSKKSGISD